ncbi:MAG: tRNA preQ1(34) S-adenosylmethionine ribosyltransferase-isomerase QueA [Thermodesulfobacteriota bacterium]
MKHDFETTGAEDVSIPADYRLSSYSYELPEDRIAQCPADRRDASRLLLLDRASGRTELRRFSDLPGLLPPGTLLVANNTRVVPARLFGHKPSGGRVEFLLLTPPPLLAAEPVDDGQWTAVAQGLLRASKALKVGEEVGFGPDLRLVVEERGEYGQATVRLYWRGALHGILERQGRLPLPPYIRRPDGPADAERYQTVYSSPAKAGSAAAPTAGLHFTPQLRARLADLGFEWAEVTLYVGYGTFSPVRCADVRQHRMHSEYVEIGEEAAAAVARAKAEGRPVAAVGTTSARALEGAFAASGRIAPHAGWTDIYLLPGSRFNVADILLTNFHLPESSLLIMVSALAGREAVLDAYRRALDNGFRFFSYGDAMLIR